jgi:hypothetical protein
VNGTKTLHASALGMDQGSLLTTLIGVAAHDLYTGSNIVL